MISIAERSTYKHPNSQFVDALSAVLYLLGLFVVFLSGFLITNTLQAILGKIHPGYILVAWYGLVHSATAWFSYAVYT